MEKIDKILEDEELGLLVIRVNPRAKRLIFRTKSDAIYVSVPPGTTSAEITDAINQLRVKLRGFKEKTARPSIDLDYRIETEYFKLSLVAGERDRFLAHSELGEMRIVCPPTADFTDSKLQEWLHKVIEEALRRNAKIILPLRTEIEKVLNRFEGLVVLDEAYNDFSEAPSFLANLKEYPNLVVLQTFSKAWGCAAIRLGMAFASVDIINILNKIKYPYNVNDLTQKQGMQMLHKHDEIERWVKMLKEEREYLEDAFTGLPCVLKVFPSDANFFLARVTDAVKIYNYLVGEGIIVRNRHNISLCCNCLRVTVGTRMENDKLLEALKRMGPLPSPLRRRGS